MAAYTKKHALPSESHTKEILIRRHTSIRRSLRSRSFRESVGRKKVNLSGTDFGCCGVVMKLYSSFLRLLVISTESNREKHINYVLAVLFP